MQSTRPVCMLHNDLWGLVVFYDDPSDLSASSDLEGFAASIETWPFYLNLCSLLLSGLLFKQEPNLCMYCSDSRHSGTA